MKIKITGEIVATLIAMASKLYISSNGKNYSKDDVEGVVVDPDTIFVRDGSRWDDKVWVLGYEALITMKDGRWIELELRPSVNKADFKLSGMRWLHLAEQSEDITHLDGMWPECIEQ